MREGLMANGESVTSWHRTLLTGAGGQPAQRPVVGQGSGRSWAACTDITHVGVCTYVHSVDKEGGKVRQSGLGLVERKFGAGTGKVMIRARSE